MTTISYRDTRLSSALAQTSVSHPFTAFVARLRADWDRWQTERAIEALPSDMRKDIGWPTSDIQQDGVTKQ